MDRLASNPLKATLETPVGVVVLKIKPGRQAEISLPLRKDHPAKEPAPILLAHAGVFVHLKARLVSTPDGWAFDSFDAVMKTGLGERVCDAAVAGEVERVVREAAVAFLDAHAELLVHADLAHIIQKRQAMDSKIEQVEWEIARRRDKLKLLRRDKTELETRLSEQEADFRAELAELKGQMDSPALQPG